MITYEMLNDGQKALMPNLFLIGSAKSGTTSLHSYLSAHPEITGSTQKEPSFFVDQSELEAQLLLEAMRPEAHDLDSYLAIFRGPAPTRYRMEASPTYSNFPMFTGVGERIARASPDARILYLLRNPVDRAISHYWHDRKLLIEKRSMEDAITLDSHYVVFGDYELQIEQYSPYFNDIIIIASEDLRTSPHSSLNSIFRALGVESTSYGQPKLGEKNTTAANTRVARFPLVQELRDTRTWKHIRNRLPRRQLDLIRRFTVKEVPRTNDGEAAVRAKLAAHFIPKVRQFDLKFGQNLSSLWFPEQAL